MARTAAQIASEAAEIRRAFAAKFAALDAKCREVVATTVRAAEEKKIKSIRALYE